MIRGPRNATVVCRKPDGSLTQRSKVLRKTYTGWTARIPFLRGVIIMAETLHLGAWSLLFSQSVALAEEEDEEPDGVGLMGGVTLALSLVLGLGLFLLAPVLATSWLENHLEPDILAVILEGVLRLVLLLGYLWLIGRMNEIRRVFEYHGAEHMTISAWESGLPLTVPNIRQFSRAHPRCGTSFLLVVAVLSILVFTALGTPPLWWRLTSRIVFVPFIAAIAYETIRLGGTYRHRRVVGWLFAPNLWLQALTTRPPEDAQIVVAVAAMDSALAQEQNAGALEAAAGAEA